MKSDDTKIHAGAEAELRQDALRILHAALRAADAGEAVRRAATLRGDRFEIAGASFELRAFRRIILLAIGKAAVPMAAALGDLCGERLTVALVVTKYGHASGAYLPKTRIIESAHPIPDRAGEIASQAVREFVGGLREDDLLLVAVSGGASALLPAPVSGITLQEKQQTTGMLLQAGADITELNTVRKHLSTLKGGRLAQLARPATVVSLLLSDVVGDRIDVIGSGTTAPDASTFTQALGVLKRFELLGRVPISVREHLENGAAGLINETPKAGDPVFERVHHFIVGSNRLALEAAAAQAHALGYQTLILSSCLTGETRQVAGVHAQILREVVEAGHPVRRPACLLSGGETTVTVGGNGKGGRNQEFALAAARQVADLSNALILSAGTDGTDGPTDAAGAIATGTTSARSRELGMQAEEYLARNDSYPFFEALGDLIRTGATGTNVMDVNILLAG